MEINTVRYIDLLLYDLKTRKVKAVLDTKYKTSDSPSSSDVDKVVTYATSLECSQAILVYPVLIKSLNIQVGNIQVQGLTFSLEGDLDQAGLNFIKSLDFNEKTLGGFI